MTFSPELLTIVDNFVYKYIKKNNISLDYVILDEKPEKFIIIINK